MTAAKMSGPRPTAIECLANLLLGVDPERPALPAPEGIGVDAALERAVLQALERPPCLVSFSGGRDSSAILGLAVQTARRHGLPSPVAAMMRFPRAVGTDETSWQELVLDHLGMRERHVVELTDQLDLLGPVATGLLRREGVRWPVNGYMHVPLLERAQGGSLLTGAGGDELFGTRAARHVLVARGRERPTPRDVRSFARVALPRAAREWWWRRGNAPAWPWLTPAGTEVLGRALGREDASWPHRWDASVRHWYRSRAYVGIQTRLASVASAWDVAVVSPFTVPGVLAELAAAGGPTGFDSRDRAMHQLFGELLPDAVLTRASKAEFSGALWGPGVREFASGWSGAGVDEHWIDTEALRREWLSEQPDFRTVLLLHTAWTESQRRPSPEHLQ
jgi:hypothetical protein